MTVPIKRVYKKPARKDGFRILVDRLWPRGISKKAARIDLWMKEVAPSSKLRKWFHADKAGRRKDFSKRYGAELRKNPALAELKKVLRKQRPATLLTSVKDLENSHIPVLLRQIGR